MITRFIYPHALRQSISSRLVKHLRQLPAKDISLAFNPHIKLDLCNTDLAHQSIILNGFYELILSRKMITLAQKGGLLVDVGANYGYFACLWASLHSGNKVLGLEAAPDNFAAFKHNIQKNNLDNQVKAFSLAAGRYQAMQKFAKHSEQGQTGWGGLTNEVKGNFIDVQVQTLDNFLEQLHIGKVDVLKVDTEGADTWVLMGSEKLLKNKAITNIFFEQNLVRMKELSIDEGQAESFLSSCGYVVRKISHNEFHAYPQ